MDQFAIFISLFIMGLVSSAHCLGMCGGIMGALSLAIPTEARHKRWLILLSYNLGRIFSYASMGLLAGFFSAQLQEVIGSSPLRILAGLMMIAMGLYLADWWRGLTRLENLGRYLWVYIQPWGKKLMPVTTPVRALLLGTLWGWLPCGLVYAALASALTQPVPSLAAGAMLAFGLGTLPAVLVAGAMAQSLARALQGRRLRYLLATVVMLLGLWVIGGAFGHQDHQHTGHQSGHEHVHGQSFSSASQRTDEAQQMLDNNSTKDDGKFQMDGGEHHHHH